MDPSDEHTVNVLVPTFPGLSSPRTLSVPLKSSTPLCEVYEAILSRFPSPPNTRYILSTPGHNDVSALPNAPLSCLLRSPQDTMLTLRITVPLCGGKGGFGSQLRAAGGRMSKRRKKDGDDKGSSRNLDGRRLRTINEAKALAEYLAVKPDMDKRAKEERRKRWADIVEMSEKKEDEIRNAGASGKGKVSEQWLEDKDEAAERTRAAVLRVMRSGDYSDQRFEKVLDEMEAEEEEEEGQEDEDDETERQEEDVVHHKDISPGSSSSGNAPSKAKTKQYFGFDDEDDEFMSDESGDESNTSVEQEAVGKGKTTAGM